jgi:hypothetical protein
LFTEKFKGTKWTGAPEELTSLRRGFNQRISLILPEANRRSGQPSCRSLAYNDRILKSASGPARNSQDRLDINNHSRFDDGIVGSAQLRDVRIA